MTTQEQPKVTRVTVRAKGQITLPPTVRQALQTGEGDQVEFTVGVDGAVSMRGLRTIPADQAWFWTPEWQAGERAADADIAAGRGRVFHSDEEFLEFLEAKTAGEND